MTMSMRQFAMMVLVLFVAAWSFPAQAEIFVWKDAKYDIKVTYPDNWMTQGHYEANLRLHVLAPQGLDHAACRIYASDDGRFKDAPPSWAKAVNAYVFSADQMQREIYVNRRDVNDVQTSAFTQHGSLGPSAASVAYVDFQKNWNDRMFPMKALMVGAHAHGTRIVFICETLASAWPRWEITMRQIMKSVTFPPAFTAYPQGYYRNFPSDGGTVLPLNRRGDAYTIR